MKRNKWIVIGIILLTILTPRVTLAKGFHDDGGGDFGGDHIVFHDDDGGAGHDDVGLAMMILMMATIR